MRVLLTGGAGLVGTWLRRTVPGDVDLVTWMHRVDVDLRDRDAVIAGLTRVRPEVVVHAAVALDEASIVDATRHVVDGATRIGAHLVHLSTDAVFSGDGRPRAEDATPDPIADYGRWKASAEDLVRRGSETAAVVRLPLVVSLDPEDGATARIRRGAVDGSPTSWFEDEIRQPAMAADLAPTLWRIAVDRRSGVWHLPGPERLSRHGIARRVVQALGLDAGCIVAEATPTDAVRPRDLHLLDDRARRELGWDPPPILR